jgi:hypothetical protein
MVEKLHAVSQYLGDEVVILGVKDSKDISKPGFAIVADLRENGLDDLLNKQFATDSQTPIKVLNEQSLSAPEKPSNGRFQMYALIRQKEAVFSNNLGTLRLLNTRLNAGASGFATGDFGKQISAAYGRGAGVIFAADLQSMLAGKPEELRAGMSKEMEDSGMNEVRYLIAEHRELNGTPENHLNLQFSGTRQRVASWLAAPAPIGSLEYVTPNASLAVAVLTKDPKSIADDLMTMSGSKHGKGEEDRTDAKAKMLESIRDELAGDLGGDFLVSIDGPVLPTPSWKAVIEVRNSNRLEQTIEQLAKLSQSIREQDRNQKGEMKSSHAMAIETTQVGTQRFYTVKDTGTGTEVANYTFSDGFMILAPTRALIMEALQAKESGNSLAHAAAFKALLPKDENENYSAIAYQNVGPILTPLLSQLGGGSADAIRQIAADGRPTAVFAWGRDNRIEAASDSRLFGLDFLTLGSLLNSRNKIASPNVKE